MIEWISMPTSIYKSKTIRFLDGSEAYITPLKLKYLREFMEVFSKIHDASNDTQSISVLTDCVAIALQQYFPGKKYTQEDVENMMNMPMINEILDLSANIIINQKSEEPVKQQAEESGSTWETLDLAKLEAELFLLGIWKDYEDLETSLSLPELVATLEAKRESEYAQNKFLAAIQGVDLDEEAGEEKGQKEWEDLKARVFSQGQTSDSNDIVALQGQNAVNAGFGIGMGLDYEDLRN
jgi:hypothetical protein